MKRVIIAATYDKAQVNAFTEQVKALVNSKMPSKHPVHFSYWGWPGMVATCSISDAVAKWDARQIDLESYIRNNDVSGAAKAVLQLIEKGIASSDIVYSENYDEALSQYAEYLDIVSNIVADVASNYDSDMSYNVDNLDEHDKDTTLEWLIEHGKVYFVLEYTTMTRALGWEVESKDSYGYNFTNGQISVDGPTGIYYNGHSIDPSLKYFKEDCARLRVALTDYFESLAARINQDESYRTPKHADDYPEREAERLEREQQAAAYKPVRKNWASVIKQLAADYEEVGDPMYEMTDSGEYIDTLCGQVHDKLNLYVEPSVQGGSGGVWIYDNATNETVVGGYDFETFDEEILDIAFSAKNATDFKRKYAQYLKSLIE